MFYGLCLALGVTGSALHFLLEDRFLWQGASLIWGSGLVLLVYGLIRDIYLIKACPCEELPKEQKKKSSMMCVESCVGFAAVSLGLVLQLLEWTKMVNLSLGVVLGVSALILAFGHKTRNMVFILAEVPDHKNIIPTFRLHTAEETQNLLS